MNEILLKLLEILINIFSQKSDDSIKLSEKIHFFSILLLFVENYSN